MMYRKYVCGLHLCADGMRYNIVKQRSTDARRLNRSTIVTPGLPIDHTVLISNLTHKSITHFFTVQNGREIQYI